jgi:hypothetical protein
LDAAPHERIGPAQHDEELVNGRWSPSSGLQLCWSADGHRFLVCDVPDHINVYDMLRPFSRERRLRVRNPVKVSRFSQQRAVQRRLDDVMAETLVPCPATGYERQTPSVACHVS